MKLCKLLPKSGSYFPIIITYSSFMYVCTKQLANRLKVHSRLNDFSR